MNLFGLRSTSSRRATLATAALLGVAGCNLDREPSGTVISRFSTGIVYGVVRSDAGTALAGVQLDLNKFPIDTRQGESGVCAGPLTAGTAVTTDASGRYRALLDGPLNQAGIGCVRITARPPEQFGVSQLTVEHRDVPYTVAVTDSARVDIVLPRTQ